MAAYTRQPRALPGCFRARPARRHPRWVNINLAPARRGWPTRPRAIQNRINEISFNASLLRELRAIEFGPAPAGQRHHRGGRDEAAS